MKQILEVSMAPQEKTDTSTTKRWEGGLHEHSRNQIPRETVIKLFEKFRRVWGEKWSGRFKTEVEMKAVMGEWHAALSMANLTADQIKYAFDMCRQTCVWPPAIAEFVSNAKDMRLCPAHKPIPRARRLEKSRTGISPEVAGAIAEIKRKLLK